MYEKYRNENQNIKRSMIVLSLSLILIYIILYYVKWDLWETDINSYVTNLDIQEVAISELQEADFVNTEAEEIMLDEPETLTWDLEFPIEDEVIIESEVEEIDEDLKEDSVLLSGTKTYYWELDFVETLGISYEYALKDDKNIYYLNMWDYDYDFSDIVRKLKWSLYVMNTEQELIANSMFGDKVTYINIPDYKEDKVLVLLEIDSQSWLLAIDYAIYHQVKPYLKTLFID